MSPKALVIATILSALAVIGIISMQAWRTNHQLEIADKDLAEARQAIESNATLVASLKTKLTESDASIDQLKKDIKKEKESATRTQTSLEQEMRNAIESKDVTISQLQGKLTVNILDRIMFESGEADLKTGGQSVLQQVANVLAQHPQLKIHVIGHTDNVPIRAGARGKFPSNWELSTARATAAVRFLTEKAGVDPHRVGAVGYGEYRPIADNSTLEGRAKNRRIAITILSEELAGADVVPTAKVVSKNTPVPEAVSTNAPSAEGTNNAGTQ